MSAFLGTPGPPEPAQGAPGTVVDWRPPPGPPGWLVGAGTTRGERVLVGVATVLGTALAAAGGSDAWRWWQWALVLVVAVDVVGGVAANALATAKRQYHGPTSASGAAARVLRHPVAFTAAHVHPFVLALVLPGGAWPWAAFWYACCVTGVAAVHAAPLHLARPVAFAVLGTLLVAAPLVDAPAGLAWFGPLLACKLVAAHAVREEPYRPAPPA